MLLHSCHYSSCTVSNSSHFSLPVHLNLQLLYTVYRTSRIHTLSISSHYISSSQYSLPHSYHFRKTGSGGNANTNSSSGKFNHASDSSMVDHVALSLSSLYVSVSEKWTRLDKTKYDMLRRKQNRIGERSYFRKADREMVTAHIRYSHSHSYHNDYCRLYF